MMVMTCHLFNETKCSVNLHHLRHHLVLTVHYLMASLRDDSQNTELKLLQCDYQSTRYILLPVFLGKGLNAPMTNCGLGTQWLYFCYCAMKTQEQIEAENTFLWKWRTIEQFTPAQYSLLPQHTHVHTPTPTHGHSCNRQSCPRSASSLCHPVLRPLQTSDWKCLLI